jgi:hypothetical protein
MTRVTLGFVACVAFAVGWIGCAPPKSPADPQRERERMTEVGWVLTHLKARRAAVSQPQVLESLQSTINEDATAIEQGDVTLSTGWTRMMRNATAKIRAEHPNAVVRGYPISTRRLDSLSFPLELEEAKEVRVVVTVVRPRDGDDRYNVFVIAELLGRLPSADFDR